MFIPFWSFLMLFGSFASATSPFGHLTVCEFCGTELDNLLRVLCHFGPSIGPGVGAQFLEPSRGNTSVSSGFAVLAQESWQDAACVACACSFVNWLCLPTHFRETCLESSETGLESTGVRVWWNNRVWPCLFRSFSIFLHGSHHVRTVWSPLLMPPQHISRWRRD